eukprot:4203347-Amphidinium_carterae.1
MNSTIELLTTLEVDTRDSHNMLGRGHFAATWIGHLCSSEGAVVSKVAAKFPVPFDSYKDGHITMRTRQDL